MHGAQSRWVTVSEKECLAHLTFHAGQLLRPESAPATGTLAICLAAFDLAPLLFTEVWGIWIPPACECRVMVKHASRQRCMHTQLQHCCGPR